MVVFLEQVAADVVVGVWKFDPVCSLEDTPQEVAPVLETLCESRRREIASTYSLLRIMTNGADLVVRHNSYGKPFVEGWNISISHTRGFVSVILSRNLDVAVDMEYIDTRVNRIAHKFLRADETPSGLIPCIIHWCAKEAMYKLYSEQHLPFSDIRISPFVLNDHSGKIFVENVSMQTSVTFHYSYNVDYVIVYGFRVSCEKVKK